MGKSTELGQECDRLNVAGRNDRAVLVDLSKYGSDALLDSAVFQSGDFQLPNTDETLHVFFDGFDQCLALVPNLVRLLLDFLKTLPRDRVRIRIASRSVDWPDDMESGLRELFGDDQVIVYQLLPLRKSDVLEAATAENINDPDAFLRQVLDIGAAALACRPITLKFLMEFLARTTDEGEQALLRVKVCSLRPDCGCDHILRQDRHLDGTPA
jgi:hypothetical protein